MTERKQHENEREVFFVRRYDDKWCVDGSAGGRTPFVCDTEDEANRWRDRLHDVWYDGVIEGRRRQASGVLRALGLSPNIGYGGGRPTGSDEVAVRIDKP